MQNYSILPELIFSSFPVYAFFATPIAFGTLLVINRRDLTTLQGIGLLGLVWLLPIFGFIAALAYLWFVLPRSR